MCSNQICVDDIYAVDDSNAYEFFAHIKNISILREKIAIGENVTSNEFGMIFPDSIGRSKWKLLFYPRGQYANGQAGSGIGIYLVMLACEQRYKILEANVTFQLQSQIDNDAAGHGPVKNLNAEFNFSDPNKRWIGEPSFVAKNWWVPKRRKRFFKNDTLIVKCSVEETKKTRLPDDNKPNEIQSENQKGCISKEDFQNNNNIDWCNASENDVQKQELGNQDNGHQDWQTVDSKKGKPGKPKKQPKKQDIEDHANASKPKNNSKRKQQNKSHNKWRKKKK